MINSLNDAVDLFLSKIDHRFHPDLKHERSINGQRGIIANVYGDSRVVYYVFFKRDWFNKFDSIFNKPGEGKGQTFSLYAINDVLMNNTRKAFFVVVMPNNEIYYTNANDAAEYITNVRTLRQPSTESTLEGSIPHRMLQRYGE